MNSSEKIAIELDKDTAWIFVSLQGAMHDIIPFKQADLHYLMSILKQDPEIGINENGQMFSKKAHKRPFALCYCFNNKFDKITPVFYLAPDEFAQLIEYLSSVHRT